MAKKLEKPNQDAVHSLFDKLIGSPDEAPKVNDLVTSGRRWDLTQKEVKGEVLVLLDYGPITTQFGESWLANAEYRGEPIRLLVGGDVLRKQIEELKEALPMAVVIDQPGRSYVFVDPTPEQLDDYYHVYVLKDREAPEPEQAEETEE